MITHYKLRSGQPWKMTDDYAIPDLVVWFRSCCIQWQDFNPEITLSQEQSSVVVIIWHRAPLNRMGANKLSHAYKFESELQAAVALKVLQQTRKGMNDEPKA